ncbi:MAG: IS110 family transposase [Planctomycetia bacterium]
MSHGYDKYVGIDVAKESLDVSGLTAGSPSQFENTAAGRAKLLSLLPQVGACLLVAEATGGYERELVAEVVAAGHHIAVVNPRQVRDFAKAIGLLAKTDRIDAGVIARFGEATRPTPQGFSEQQEQLRELIVRRRQLVDHRTAEKNRCEQAHSTLVRNSVRKSIEGIDKDLKRIGRAIIQFVESNDDWRGRYERLKSVPGVGTQRAASLMAELQELGRLNTAAWSLGSKRPSYWAENQPRRCGAVGRVDPVAARLRNHGSRRRPAPVGRWFPRSHRGSFPPATTS